MARVLVTTISAETGGVPQMLRFACDCLSAQGHEPVVACYEPYSRKPSLSVPLWRLGTRVPGEETRHTAEGYERHLLGAWLPELEFTHYLPRKGWKMLVDSCGHHMTVSGSCLAATPYLGKGEPFLVWAATPWHEDRAERVKDFPLVRRILDRAVNAPVLRRLERKILRRGRVLALSAYTREKFREIAGEEFHAEILPSPVDTAFFRPDLEKVVPGRVGFSGRLDDPRKNLPLLLQALAGARAEGVELTAVLIGGEPDGTVLELVRRLNIERSVRFERYLSHERLLPILQSLDLFALPSHQEGLCIAALEAMACGCPVISTPCGGPEEYVLEGRTGKIAGYGPELFAGAMKELVQNRGLREACSRKAREMVEERYSLDRARGVFRREFEAVFTPTGQKEAS